MKIQKRNIATVILAILCAITLAIGVSFVMPKTEAKSANAASYNTADLKIDTGSVQGQYYSAYAGNVSNSSLSPGTLPTGTVTATDTSVTFAESSSNKNAKAAYFEFKVGINVPAWQEYEVSFDIAYAMKYTLPGFTNTITGSCGMYMYKPDTDDPNFAPLASTLGITYTTGVAPTVSNSDILSVVGTASGAGACSKNMTLSSGIWTLRNESNAEKTYTFTLAMVMTTVGCGATNNCYTIINNFSATLQNTKVKVETLALTTDSDTGLKAVADTQTYTGSALSFDVFYDTTNINQTSLVCIDRYGSTIGTSDYNLNVTNGVGSLTATMAGTYTLTFELNSAATNAGITWWDDTTAPKTLTLTIDPIEVDKLISPAKQIYDGNTKSFTVNGYDATFMTSGKKNNAGAFETNLPTGLIENASHAFDTTAAGKYTVAFRLPLDSVDGTRNNNYVWKNDTSSFITLDLEVEQRTLEFNWDLLSGLSNWTVPITQQGAFVWNYTGVSAGNQPVSGENVKLQCRFYYDADGDAYASTPVDSLDVKDLHDKNGAASRPQGDYTVYLVIVDDSANGGVDGKNYKLGSTATLTVTLGAGKADLDQLIKQVAIGSALPVDIDGLSGLEYSIADGTEAVVTQKFDIGWGMAVDYLVLGTDFGGSAYKYEKWDGSSWIGAANTNGAGKYKVTASLKIAAGKDYKFDTALIGSTTSKGFTVESVSSDGLSAVISFEVEIAKKDIDTSGFTLQYSYDQTNWKDFGTDNKTEYVDSTIYVRIKPSSMKPTVAGITAKFGTSDYATGKLKQTYNVTASFTLTDSDNFKISDKAFSWSITNKQIVVDSNADWEQVDYTFDGVDYIGELLGIKGHSTYYPNVIEYEYFWYPENNPSDVHTGTGDAEAKTILTTASDINKLKVTITVKIKSSVTDYELTGGAQTCAEFTVGSDKTPITVTTAGNATYGDITGEAGFGVSVTKVSDGSPVAATGILGEIYSIYLHQYDGLSVDSSVAGAGTLLKDVDFSNLNAGMYVIEVRLSTVAKDNYSLRNGKSLFEIEKKKIPVPTLSDIVFNNQFIDLRDYLGGS
ncbi:MAG: hypothetical protein K2N52_03445, partial [Clostridia bacterium]|nr:hypothetical protein [Clostridia bacterium]